MKKQSILIIPGLIVGGLSAIGWADLVPLWAAIPIASLFVFWLAFFSIRFATAATWSSGLPSLLLALLALAPCTLLDGFGVKSLLTVSESTGLGQSIAAESTAISDRTEYDFALSRHEAMQREIEGLTAEIATARQVLIDIQAEQRVINGMDSDGLANDHLIPGLQAQLDARRAKADTTADIAGKQAILDSRLAASSGLKTEIERLRQAATQTAQTAHQTAQTEHLVLSLASIAGERIDPTQAATWSALILTAGGAILGGIAEFLYMCACILVSWTPKRRNIRVTIPETSPDPKKKAPIATTPEKANKPPGNIIAPQFSDPPQRGVTPSRNEETDWQPVGIHSFPPPEDTRVIRVELDTPDKIDHHFRLMNRARELPRYYKKEDISRLSTEDKFHMITIALRPEIIPEKRLAAA